MALPTDLTTFTLRFGEPPYTDASGNLISDMTGKLVPIDPATGKPLRLVHVTEGGAILPKPVDVQIVNGTGSVGPLPHTDNPSLSMVGWLYELTWNVGSNKPSPGNKRFAVPAAAGATVDFDLLDVAGSVPGVLVPVVEGQSAYRVAVANGFVGTEQQWLASLKGPQGDPSVTPEAVAANLPARLSDAALRATSDSRLRRTPVQAGRRWLFLGTSITNGSSASNVIYSYPFQAPFMAGTWRARPISTGGSYVAGTPGTTVAANLGRLQGLLDAQTPDAVFIETGPNDASDANATPLASYQATVSAMVTAVKATGAACVLATPTPLAATATAGAKLRIAQQAAWLRLWAQDNAIPLADFHRALIDQATGALTAAYDSDGIHPNTLGHALLAQVAAAAMLKAAGSAAPSPTIAAGLPGGLVANPLLVPNGTVPNGSTKPFPETGTSPTLAMETADTTGRRPAGAWAVETLAAAADSLYTRQFAVQAGWAVGDVLAVGGYVEITDNAGRWLTDVVAGTAQARIYVRNQSGANIVGGTAWERTPGIQVAPNTYAIGPAFTRFTVPEGVTGMTLNYVLQLPTGGSVVARWATLDLINLTALGLA